MALCVEGASIVGGIDSCHSAFPCSHEDRRVARGLGGLRAERARRRIPPAPLRERYAALTQALEQSPIQPGLHVESVESSSAPRGDAYAVIQYPFATVAAAFTTPQTWCESLILHLNVQYCRASINDRTRAAVGGGGQEDQSAAR